MALEQRCGVILARIFQRKATMERSFPKLNGDALCVKIHRELELQRLFEVYQLKKKRLLWQPIRGRGPASRKEQPFSIVIVTRIALDSTDEVTRKKKPFDSRKNELRSCSTDRERSRFVLESRQLAFLRVLPCISDVWRAQVFTALFTIGCPVDRPLYRCVYRGDRTRGCWDTAFSVEDHRQSWSVPRV